MIRSACRTIRMFLRTWSHTICGMNVQNDTNRAFRNVEMTVILVTCTSLGILMISSLSGVRVNPHWRSTVISCEILTWWMGRASSPQLIAHIKNPHLFNRKILLLIIIGHLVLCNVQQRAVIQGMHLGLVVFLKEGD